MEPPLELTDLSPYTPVDQDEDAWLARLAARLLEADFTLPLAGGPRVDDEDDAPLVRAGDGRWWTGRFIGEVNFEGREVRIAPRLGIETIGLWLARAMNLAILPKAASMEGRGPLVAQLVDRVWSAVLADASRHGPPRFRRPHLHEGTFVRGRLDVPASLRLRAAGRPMLASRQEPRSLVNPVAKAIVLADRTLSALLGPEKPWRPRQCDDVLGRLIGSVGANPDLPTRRQLRAVRFTPISRPFERVAGLSMEIARRRGTLTSGAGDDSSGLLIDVAELWELFLLHCARLAFGRDQVEHGTAVSSTAFLLSSTVDEGRRLGRLKPDLIVSRKGKPAAVIDAKYRRLRGSRERPSGVDRGDLYQLAAYLSGHAVELGALAYPPAPRDEAPADEFGPWKLRASNQEARFVRLPAEEGDCVSALRRLVVSPIEVSS